MELLLDNTVANITTNHNISLDYILQKVVSYLDCLDTSTGDKIQPTSFRNSLYTFNFILSRNCLARYSLKRFTVSRNNIPTPLYRAFIQFWVAVLLHSTARRKSLKFRLKLQFCEGVYLFTNTYRFYPAFRHICIGTRLSHVPFRELWHFATGSFALSLLPFGIVFTPYCTRFQFVQIENLYKHILNQFQKDYHVSYYSTNYALYKIPKD